MNSPLLILVVTWCCDTNSHFCRWLSPLLWCSSQARVFVHVHSEMVPSLLTCWTLDTKNPKCLLEAVAFSWVGLLLDSHFTVSKIQAQVQMLSITSTYLIKWHTSIYETSLSTQTELHAAVSREASSVQPWWVIGGPIKHNDMFMKLAWVLCHSYYVPFPSYDWWLQGTHSILTYYIW